MRIALTTSMVVIALVAPGYAQTPTPTPAPTPQQREAEAGNRQQFVVFMSDLRLAVRDGADSMLRQVRLESPEAELVLAGAADVEGFRLEEGMFFRVRVPAMRPSNRYALQLWTSGGRRTTGPVRPASLAPTTAATPASLVAPPAPFVDAGPAIDPDAVYTSEVKAAIIRTMIQRSAGLRIPPGQHLEVAARDDGQPDPRFPSSFTEFHTVFFRIKGTDLANFHAGRQTLAETEKLVTVRED